MKFLNPIPAKPFILSFSISAALILNAKGTQAQNLVVNSNFTNGTSTAWSTTSSVEINPETTYGGPSTTQYVTEMDVEHTMNQKVCILPGLNYTFTFQATRRPQSGTPANPGLQVKVTGVTSGTDYVNNTQAYTNTTWSPKANTFTVTVPAASSDKQVNIQFFPNNNTSTYGVLIWDIELAPAATNSLFITGPVTAILGIGNNFSVTNAPSSAKYAWSFSGDASQSTSTAAKPTGISWASIGSQTVSVAVSNTSCTMTTYSQPLSISTVLPLQWVSFTASLQDRNAALNWIIDQEDNGRYFVVQRSVNGTDFESIDSIACINSDIEQGYSYTDKQTPAGAVNYRLMHIGTNQTISYSKVIALNNETTNSKGGVSVYPNPVLSVLHYTVESEAGTSLSVRIFTSSGIVAAEKQVSCAQGMNQETVNVTSLSQGTYFLQITDMNGGLNSTRAFVKL